MNTSAATVTNNINWMDNIAEIKAVNIRKGSRNTVEYVDKYGTVKVVRVPAAFAKFCLSLTTKNVIKHT